jgi:hypothetical protein
MAGISLQRTTFHGQSRDQRVQGDSLREDRELTDINHAITCRRKRNLAYAEMIGPQETLKLPEDTGRHDAPCSRMLQPTWREGPQTEGSGATRARRHHASVANYSVAKFLYYQYTIRVICYY